MFRVFIVLSIFSGLVFSQSSSVMTSSSTSSTQLQTWEDLGVMPIRLITELSRMCIVLSRRDYTLDNSHSYTYIQYPSSYRTTLTQATNIVDRTFRALEMSMTRMQMIINQQSQYVDQVLKLLFQVSIEEREVLLPSTLQNINKIAEDVISIMKKTLIEFEQMTNFFNELLRAVQPTSRPDLSTTTSANKAPLDIDHATVLSNILNYINTLIVECNQMTELSIKLTSLTGRIMKLINDKNTLLWILFDIEEMTDLLFTLSASYVEVSRKMIVPRISSMFRDLMLDNEQECNAEVQKLIEQSNTNISSVQQYFIQSIANQQMNNKERREKYQQLINSSTK
ncbi:hypothetical protein I4U23_004967 [Adineta vaga]|nr:hypothetical protein I4U23_004967 [Adineta vaga]